MMFKGNPSGRVAAGDVSPITVCIVEHVASSRQDRQKEIRGRNHSWKMLSFIKKGPEREENL